MNSYWLNGWQQKEKRKVIKLQWHHLTKKKYVNIIMKFLICIIAKEKTANRSDSTGGHVSSGKYCLSIKIIGNVEQSYCFFYSISV